LAVSCALAVPAKAAIAAAEVNIAPDILREVPVVPDFWLNYMLSIS